jgi:hypothetical protein
VGLTKYIYISILILLTCSIVRGNHPFIYLSPLPGAKWVSVKSTILIRLHDKRSELLDPSRLMIRINGEKSGYHEGRLFIAADQITYIFKPYRSFDTNETVDVRILTDLDGLENEFSYQFTTSSIEVQDQEVLKDLEHMNFSISKNKPISDKTTSVINGVAVPSDFPPVSVDILQETAPGKLFLATEGGIPYLLILENDGTPYFYQRLSDFSRDFKVQPTGTLTRRERNSLFGFVEMDSNFQIIDTLICGNGYGADQHEAQILPNGNYLLIGVDLQPIDMSKIIEGGNPNAKVYGNHVLEHDPQGNVIFEWRSWDHFNILDAEHVNFSDLRIDYVHMNSIAVDYDSNIVISSRHLSEVTKIDRKTGEIIWRLGGKHNQFEFVNDIDSISYQHDVRPVPGMDNHYTIFDNGNYKEIRYSRAVEFLIDTTTMTATKVWEYRHSPDRYAYAMGSVQRLPNGNTLINWSGNPYPIATEVTPEGEIVYEMRFTNGVGNYRTFRFEWSGIAKTPYLILEKYDDRITLIFNKFGDRNVQDYLIYAGLGSNPDTPIDSTAETWIDLTDFKYNERYFFRVTARDSNGLESEYSNEVNALINFVTPGENMILNGDFEDGDIFWDLEISGEASASGSVEDEVFLLVIDTIGTSELDVQLKQGDITLQEGRNYILDFDAYAASPRTMEVNLEKATSPFDNYSRIGFVLVETTLKHYTYEFQMDFPTDPQAQLVFNCGHETPSVYFDNISLKQDISAPILEDEYNVRKKFKLFTNYPNPFNPKTIINYELPITNDIDLSIYNVLGKKVVTLVSEKQKAGQHQVEWDASGYASGVYYYQLRTSEGYLKTKKMILLR